jgi:hypothetical protein
MKKLISILILLIFCLACNNETNDIKSIKPENMNALLSEKVKMQDRIPFKNKDNPDWVAGLNHIEFVEDFFQKTFSGEFTNTHSTYIESDNVLYGINNIKQRMGIEVTGDSILDSEIESLDSLYEKGLDLSEITEIITWEEWEFDKKSLLFSKKIKAWAFVREYYRADDTLHENARYRLPFIVKNDETAVINKKLAENIISVFNLDYHEYLDRIGFGEEEFFKFLLENIEAGKLKTYDPIYLIDRSKREFTTEELKNFAGIEFDYVDLASEVYKFIFIEDWYYDEKTFCIEKKVKGLGLVADRLINDEWQDKILFFLFFD